MIPVKIKALNQDSSDESNEEEDESPITKEALEQKLQLGYREALILQKQNKLDEAETILSQLIESEVLREADGKVKYINGKLQPSIFHLKYCCYLNLGNITFKQERYKLALEYYSVATELDDTDLNLWFKIGKVALKIPNLMFAVSAFMETLYRNPKHWPSINSIITATYALGDMAACLLYIHQGLSLDKKYLKGLIFKKRIFSEHPHLKEDFYLLFPHLKTEQIEINWDETTEQKFFSEVETLKSKDPIFKKKICAADSENHPKELLKPLKSHSWLHLGKSLLKLYNHLYNNSDEMAFFSEIALKSTKQPKKETMSLSEESNGTGGVTNKPIISSDLENKEKSSTENSDSENKSEENTVVENDDRDQQTNVDNGAGSVVDEKKVDNEDQDDDDIVTELRTSTPKLGESDNDVSEPICRAKRRKCSPTLADQLKYCDKRRSTRNKTVLKSNEPSLSKILKNLIPPKLLPQKQAICKSNYFELMRWNDDSFDTMDIYRLLFEHQDQNNLPSCPTNQVSDQIRNRTIQEENYFGGEKEKSDIDWYININDEQPILELMEAYLRELAKKWALMWPAKLTNIFLEMCRILKKHGKDIRIFPNGGISDTTDDSLKLLKDNLLTAVLFGELLLDQCFEDTTKSTPLDGSIFGGDFSSLLMGEMRDACCAINAIETDVKLLMRAYWLEALLFLRKKNSYGACSALSMLVDEIPDSNVEVRLPNIRQFYLISQNSAKRLLNTLIRNEDLGQVQALFAAKDFERVVDTLENTLKPDSQQLVQIPNETTLSRYQQYTILLAALSELKRYEELFKWCEVCCYESFAIYRKSFFDEIDTDMKSKWASLVINTLNSMVSCLKNVGLSIVKVLSEEHLTRLVQTLSSLVCHQIEATDPIPEITASTVAPWILLCNIVHFHEKEQEMAVDDDISEVIVLPSVSILFVAHEHLGKRNWCCFDDGDLLFYTLDVIEGMFKRSIPFTETWQTFGQQIDQIFYCLYSHPFKRNKPRYVQDHNSLGLALTWNRAVQAYSFYRPAQLPMFDTSPKQYTINADTETLLKRMIPLIPEEQNPDRFVECVNQFTNGVIKEIPTNENPLPAEVIDIFYLLADYYFKNKIMGKAIKYYSYDVCFNRHRFDSWAAMALARGSNLEMKLNSCETIKNESEILKKAEHIDKCYKTALELDASQSKLWIEYGVFCYSIHGFCSRLLKQETTNLSLQMFDTLEKCKNEFLKTSLECFNSVNEAFIELIKKDPDVQDERWLHHYMLGKIAEKNEEKPKVYLDHYIKSLRFLDQNGAEYPSRILYSSPQYYSVEALEVYYRTHTTILKLLESHEEKPLNDSVTETLIDVTNQLAESAFAKAGTRSNADNREIAVEDLSVQKTNENVGSTESSEDTEAVIRKVLDEVLTQVVNNLESSTKRKISDDVVSIVEGSLPPKKAKLEEKPNQSEVPESKKTDIEPMEICSTDKSPENHAPPIITLESSDSESSSDSSDESSSSDEENPSTKVSKSPEARQSDKETNWKEVQRALTDKCLVALEECIRRFPEHYKSYYRLANHYFRSKQDRDIEKARKYLFIDGGLFADQKASNFFNGIWRIPTGEIDRSGSFAFHMSRSVHLLVDVLRETQDFKMLLSLYTQLKDTPELDKKYIRDNEREQISKEALSLSAQILRKHIDNVLPSDSEENKRKLLLEVYNCYKISKIAPFGKFLLSMFYKYTDRKDKVSLEQMLSFCKSLNTITKESMAPTLPPAHCKDNAAAPGIPKPLDIEARIQALNFAFSAESKLFSNIPARKSEPKRSFSPTIPNNLKNLPSTITVTTVPKSKPAAASSMWKNLGNFVDMKSALNKLNPKKEKKLDMKLKLDPISKAVIESKAARAFMKLSAAGVPKERIPPKVKPPTSHDKPKIDMSSAINPDKGLTITPVMTKEKNYSQMSPRIGAEIPSSIFKSKAPLSTPKPDIASADRPSLIITAVDPNAKNQPTLQQKLAAKQMANVPSKASNPTKISNMHGNVSKISGVHASAKSSSVINPPKTSIANIPAKSNTHIPSPKISNAQVNLSMKNTNPHANLASSKSSSLSVSKHHNVLGPKTTPAFDLSKNLGASGVSIFALPKPDPSASRLANATLPGSSSTFQNSQKLFISKVSANSAKKSPAFPRPSKQDNADVAFKNRSFVENAPGTLKNNDEKLKNALRALEESSNIIITPKVPKKNDLEVITLE